MPQAVFVWIAAIAGTITVLQAIIATVAIVGGMAYSASKARKSARQARDGYNAAQVDRLVNVTSALSARDLVLGTCRKAGSVMYKASTGDYNKDMYLVLALAGHEIDAVIGIYFNDTLVTLNENNYVTNAPYSTTVRKTGKLFDQSAIPSNATNIIEIHRNVTLHGEIINTLPSLFTFQYDETTSYAQVWTHLGGAGQVVDPVLAAAFPDDWASTNVAEGIAYLVCKFTYNETAFPSGMPAVTAVMRGAKVYDPRTTTTVWSENPALLLRHAYTHPKFGKATITEEEDARIVVAANACDEVVEYTIADQIVNIITGQTRKLFTASLVVPFGTPAGDLLDDLSQAMGGSWAFSGGSLYVKAGVYTAPVLSLTEADLAVVQRTGGSITQTAIKIGVHKARADQFNTVKVNIWDEDQGYKSVYLPPLVGTALKERDGVERVLDITFAAISYAPQALHVAGILMRDARDPLNVEIPFKLSAYAVELLENISLTIPRYGWDAKVFQVLGRTWTSDGNLILTLKETAAEITQRDAEFIAGGYADNTNLPEPWIVETLGDLTVTSGTTELIKQADGTVVSNMRVRWPLVTDGAVLQNGNIEIQYRHAESLEGWTVLMAEGNDTTVMTSEVNDGEFYEVRGRARTSLGIGNWSNQVVHKVIGKTEPPSDVPLVTYALETLGIRISWIQVPDVDVLQYEIRTGADTWEASTSLGFSTSDSYLWAIQQSGERLVWVKAIDTSGNYSLNATSVLTVITGPAKPVITSYTLEGPDLIVSWVPGRSGFLVDRYEIRRGTDYIVGTFVNAIKGTSYRTKATFAGTQLWWIAAIDAANNTGAPASLSILINPPGPVLNSRSEIVDNSVLLYWSPPTTTALQLPIDRYEVRKGDTWASGASVGSNGNSTFAAVFEQAAGLFTYWIAAVDTAGSAGTAVGIQATITQPPDYTLRDNYNSDFSGTWVNFYEDNGVWTGPVDITQTWTSHYVDNSWASPDAQVTAGFPIYFEPSLASGSYEEDIDYGTDLPPTVITCTLQTVALVGTVDITCTISWKLDAGDAWTDLAPGVTTSLLPEFRYVKIHYDFDGAIGANFISVIALNVKLAVKYYTASGAGTADVGGSVVTFNTNFLVADTPIVQPNGPVPRIPVVIYEGTPNPTGFTVILYDLSGVDVGGSFSWTVRGF